MIIITHRAGATLLCFLSCAWVDPAYWKANHACFCARLLGVVCLSWLVHFSSSSFLELQTFPSFVLMQDLYPAKQKKFSFQHLFLKVNENTEIDKVLKASLQFLVKIRHMRSALFRVMTGTHPQLHGWFAGRAKWIDRNCTRCLILWLTVQDWASHIFNFVITCIFKMSKNKKLLCKQTSPEPAFRTS